MSRFPEMLSEHFALREAMTDAAAVMTDEYFANAKALAEKVLEPYRLNIAMGPVIITSWGRSPKHNATVGGALKSQHITFEAVDVLTTGKDAIDLLDKAIEQLSEIDQIIIELRSSLGYNDKVEILHMSHRRNGLQRNMVLYSPEAGKYTRSRNEYLRATNRSIDPKTGERI